MESDLEFSIEGTEEFERDLKKAIEKSSAQAEETLIELAKELKETAKKRAKSETKHIKREGDDKKWAIEKRWGHKLVDDGLGAAALVWNSAPHFHLVENGHELVRGGRVIGFVPGKHIMEKTRNEYEDIVTERFEKMVDDILGESDLN